MILMYHHVCPWERIPKDATALEGWQFNLSPEQFAKQLNHVARCGFEYISLGEYVDRLANKSRWQGNEAVVTFDDGWLDNYEYAFPVLESLKIPATFFIVAGEMAGIDRSRRMTDGQLRELQSRGIEIGGHSRTHHNLAMLGEEKLAEEIQGCRLDLQDRLGSSIDFFAYPGGRFNRRVIACCEEAGYRGSCSTISWGKNSPASRFHLFRDVLSPESNRFADRLKLSPLWRTLFRWRAQWRLRTSLSA